MTSTPSDFAENCAPALDADVLGLLEAARRAAAEHGGGRLLAIVDEKADLRFATSDALQMFAAKDMGDLKRLLAAGQGPNARRLRNLASTLPIGRAPRLERIRVSLGRRPTGVNLLCARIHAPGGETVLILSTPADEKIGRPVGTDAQTDPVDSRTGQAVHARPSLRFIWALDRDERFGVDDPLLASALGAEAPAPGERLLDLLRRVDIEHGDELARLIEKRETFYGLTVGWRRAGGDGRLRIALSAAPVFDNRRRFAGYRGYGVIEEATGVVTPAEQRESEARRPASAVEPQPTDRPASDAAHALGSAASRLEPPIDELRLDEAAQTPPLPDDEADGGQSGRTLPERAQAEAAPPETIQGRTAEIYFLHQAVAAPSRVVPIRPGAVGALASPEAGRGGGGDSVELSKSERDAFREIARALVVRQQVLPREGEIESARLEAQEGARAFQGSHPDSRSESPELGGPNRRNALGLLDRLPIGVLVACDARALYLNRMLLDLLGYRDFEHFQSSNGMATMFRGRDPQSVSVHDRGALSIAGADGRALLVEGQAQAVFWDGAPATLFSLRSWVQPELEPRLRPTDDAPTQFGSAADLQAMIERATDGAAILDAAGRIVAINRSAERLFGYDQRQVEGESLLMLLAPRSHTEATASLERLSRGEEVPGPDQPLAVVGRHRSGGALALGLTHVRIGSAEAVSYGALFRNLSREREAEDRLAAARDAALAASAAKTDFLAQISHEIRTPLSAILGFAEVMIEERFGPVGNDRYRDYLQDIHASGTHVMSLVDDLLDLSKIASGKLELEFAPVDANGVIRECVSLMQPQAARERVILRVSLYERLPRVMGDERSLKQVMLNLISNAVKYNEPGGQVIVSTAVDPGGQAVIRVRDTGVGMNENEVGLALEPFSQIARTGRKGGVGLGLPLTKALVEANKAEFSIKSRREHGTLIEIAFPVVQVE